MYFFAPGIFVQLKPVGITIGLDASCVMLVVPVVARHILLFNL